jgi:RimJ/RimL family protein N-acetyltransferase
MSCLFTGTIPLSAMIAPTIRLIQTPRLRLVLKTPEEVRAAIETMDVSEKAQLSADWLARLAASTAPDRWVHGFSIVQLDSGITVGQCGFKGPPDMDGMVEIAYGVASHQEGKGYATEAARALVAHAFSVQQVKLVRAHTLPGSIASKRVLAKCGFQYVGEITDPEDGLVWRFETLRPSSVARTDTPG